MDRIDLLKINLNNLRENLCRYQQIIKQMDNFIKMVKKDMSEIEEERSILKMLENMTENIEL